MQKCKKVLSVIMIAAATLLCTVGASAQILPHHSDTAQGNRMNMPVEDVLPHDGNLPDRLEDMIPRVEDGVIREGDAIDGQVSDNGAAIDKDMGVSGTVWGVLIAVGIAALAVLFIFLLMPRDREKDDRSSRRS